MKAHPFSIRANYVGQEITGWLMDEGRRMGCIKEFISILEKKGKIIEQKYII